MKKWLFDPFTYIAGARALLLGGAVMLVSAVICYYSNTHFDGALDSHNGTPAYLSCYLLEALSDWACVVLFMFIAGRIFSRSAVRFVDVAGTIALSRSPMLIDAIMGFAAKPVKLEDIHSVGDIGGGNIAIALVGLVLIIWMVALMYHAFKVSCNLSGGKAVGIFVACLVLAEVLSKFISNAYLFKLVK